MNTPQLGQFTRIQRFSKVDIPMEPVLIVGIIFGFVSFSAYLRFRTKQLEHGTDTMSSQLHKENEKLRKKTESLEQRVRVLESIVTTKEFTLRQEIDELSEAD